MKLLSRIIFQIRRIPPRLINIISYHGSEQYDICKLCGFLKTQKECNICEFVLCDGCGYKTLQIEDDYDDIVDLFLCNRCFVANAKICDSCTRTFFTCEFCGYILCECKKIHLEAYTICKSCFIK